MLKRALLFLCLAVNSSLFAQEESFLRYIKASPADTLLPVATTVKEQLQKEMRPLKKASQNSRLRLVLIGGNKEAGATVSRWLAAKKNQDLYLVSSGAMITKFIGETEKNLQLLFDKATATNAILFFDEADALFGESSTPGSNETNSTIIYWVKRMNEYKGTVLSACSGKACLAEFGKQKFTSIQVAASMETQ